MSDFLLIETRGPLGDNSPQFYDRARTLQQGGHKVMLYLVENGVLSVRQKPAGQLLRPLLDAGVTIHADSFSLQERGISATAIANNIQKTGLELVLNSLASGFKPLWH